MMISPATYYECNLKGKSPEQIMAKIRGLRREISRLKRVLEDPENAPGSYRFICPGPDTMLDFSEMYLARAKEALTEAGGVYVPTKKEIEAEVFEKDLEKLARFTFSIGSFFGGWKVYTVTISDDGILFLTKESGPMPEETGVQPEPAPFSKGDFMEMVKDLYLSDWKKNYGDDPVLDGIEWELKLEFRDGGKSRTFSGYGKTPWTFGRLSRFFEDPDDDPDDDQED